MDKRWLVNKTNQEFLEYLSKKTSVSTAFAQILVNRGFKDPESIKAFLSPSFDDILDPFLLPDMQNAVERIKIAVERGETIFVHGDYDADGVTSTALLVSAMRKLGLKTYYHIPNRLTEGYGVSNYGIQKAQDCGASLIITADCGISSAKKISFAGSLGIDVIVTDHHEPPEKLPEATAVINPWRRDSIYPFKGLAGVGVAYKLVQALFQLSAFSLQPSELEEFLDLVAIGTIADSVPLTGENRIFVTCGLKRLNSGTCRTGIQALKDVSNTGGRELKSGTLSYTLIPRINAAGRLGDAGEVVELFLTQDWAKAKGIAGFLEEQNRKRQRIEEDVYKSAMNMINGKNTDKAIVLHSSEWHPGVIGIVASRLVEEFYRPAFLFSVTHTNTEAVAKGSARSIPPFHLCNGIMECAELLIGFGGHSQAAGLRLSAENLPAFKERINFIVEKKLNNDDLIPTLEIDTGVELSEINFNLIKELSMLEPFGNSNEEPLLGAKGIEIIEPRVVGSNHLKMKLKQGSAIFDTIGFGMGKLLDSSSQFTVHSSQFVDAVFIPCVNEWNGSRILQLNLKALRPGV